MKIFRRTFSAMICGIFLTPHLANTGIPEPPMVVELDFSANFSCSLPFNSDPEKVTFAGLIDQNHRWVEFSNSLTGAESRKSSSCSVVGDQVYRCEWGMSKYIEIDLNNAEWVYISVKKFNYVLSGFYREGLLSESMPVKCAFAIDKKTPS